MIRHLAPLALLALAACSSVADRAFPDKVMSFDRNGITYTVEASFDAATLSWVTRTWSVQRRMEKKDRALVLDLVSRAAGSQLCDGASLTIDDGGRLNPLAGDTVMYLQDTGEWRVTGSCA